MSLDFDSTECNPPLPVDDNDSVLRDTLIFMATFTDIGWQITEDNAEEFFIRCKLIENLSGPMRFNQEGEVYITPVEVKRWIGLKVNVAPVKFNVWANKKLKNFVRDAKREFNKKD